MKVYIELKALPPQELDNMKKNIGVFLLVTPLLMGVSACNKSGAPSSEIINDNKVVRLEVESAKKEYDLREVFEPSADMKVYAVKKDETRTLVDEADYEIDSSNYVRERAGTYPIEIKSEKYNLSVSYDVKVDILDSFSILIIGNSHTDDTIKWTHEIAANLGLKDVFVADLYYGSSSMDIHYANLRGNRDAYTYRYYSNGEWIYRENTSIQYALRARHWDYVCLQEKAWYAALDYEWDLLDIYEDLLLDYIPADAGTKLCWNITWAYSIDLTTSDNALTQYFDSDQMKMYEAEQDSIVRNIVPREEIDFILNGGTAIQNARSSYLTDHRINRDYTHLSLTYGRFVAGLNLIKTLSSVDLTYLSWRPEDVTDVEFQIAIEAVENTQINPFEVTQSIYTEAI